MDLLSLTRIAAVQHGVLSLDQGSVHGVSRRTWNSMCRDGLLIEYFPNVGRLAGAPDTPLARLKAATLAVGTGAMASHTSSVFLWGGPCTPTDPIHVSIGTRSHRRTLPGIELHRPTEVRDLDPVIRQRIPTTRPLRALVDLGAVAPDKVLPALRHFIVSGLIPPRAIPHTLELHRRRGRAGVRALESALADLIIDFRPPDSLLEETMSVLFVTHGLPPFEFHAVVGGYEVDFLVVGSNVIVETDGWEWHGPGRDAFENDRERDAYLGELGYIVRRFTWRQVTTRPRWVAQRIDGTLRRWAPHVLLG